MGLMADSSMGPGRQASCPGRVRSLTGSKCPFAVPGFSSSFCRQELSKPLTKAQPTPVLWCHAPPVTLKQQQGRKTPSWCVHPARLRLGAGLSESSRGVTMHSRHRFPVYVDTQHTVTFHLQRGPVPASQLPFSVAVLKSLCSRRIHLPPVFPHRLILCRPVPR